MRRTSRGVPALLLLPALALSGCGQHTTTATTAAPTGGKGCSYPAAGQAAKQVKPPKTTGVATTGAPTYVLHTNQGDVAITLDPVKAPCTVNSFESLASQGYFNQTSCHRLTTQGIFVLQCGDPTGTGSGGPGYSFGNETSGKDTYVKGVVAMANAGPDTNGSQFFLVYADSTSLDQKPDYTVFGRMDAPSVAVVTRVAAAGANPPGDGKPLRPVKITSVTQR